jgi:hypothetical protein
LIPKLSQQFAGIDEVGEDNSIQEAARIEGGYSNMIGLSTAVSSQY